MPRKKVEKPTEPKVDLLAEKEIIIKDDIGSTNQVAEKMTQSIDELSNIEVVDPEIVDSSGKMKLL